MTSTPPPAIVRIAQNAQRQESGVVGYHLVRTFDVHAGPFKRHDDLELAAVSSDGTTVKVRVIRDNVGGRDADAQARSDLQAKYEHPNARDVFHRPFDPRYVGEYAYEQVDPQTYRFSSEARDAVHGNGTLTLDLDGDVTRMQYTPYVLPPYSRSGSVTDTRSEVLPQYWSVTREQHEYSGHYAIFSGGASVTIVYDRFKRFRDVASAVAALDAGIF